MKRYFMLPLLAAFYCLVIVLFILHRLYVGMKDVSKKIQMDFEKQNKRYHWFQSKELKLVKQELIVILGLEKNFKFSPDNLKRPYRKFMQRNHPDKNQNANSDLVSRVNELMDRYHRLSVRVA